MQFDLNKHRSNVRTLEYTVDWPNWINEPRVRDHDIVNAHLLKITTTTTYIIYLHICRYPNIYLQKYCQELDSAQRPAHHSYRTLFTLSTIQRIYLNIIITYVCVRVGGGSLIGSFLYKHLFFIPIKFAAYIFI